LVVRPAARRGDGGGQPGREQRRVVLVAEREGPARLVEDVLEECRVDPERGGELDHLDELGVVAARDRERDGHVRPGGGGCASSGDEARDVTCDAPEGRGRLGDVDERVRRRAGGVEADPELVEPGVDQAASHRGIQARTVGGQTDARPARSREPDHLDHAGVEERLAATDEVEVARAAACERLDERAEPVEPHERGSLSAERGPPAAVRRVVRTHHAAVIAWVAHADLRVERPGDRPVTREAAALEGERGQGACTRDRSVGLRACSRRLATKLDEHQPGKTDTADAPPPASGAACARTRSPRPRARVGRAQTR
jgi:hypothetical protein